MELTRTFPAAKTPISIAIIGCGSRGLTVLERLCALASLGDTPVDIHVYEPNRPGPGVHSLQQPEYLMLNTVASQISMFPDSAALGGKTGVVGREGPDFFQWCQRYKSSVHTVRANEFLPRQWLGEYLAWTYDYVIRNVPEHVRVNHYACTVDNIERSGLDGFTLTSSQGEIRDADCLVVTVGHATAPRVVDNIGAVTRVIAAYPQPLAFEGIAPGERVGIEGLGLCAMDVVAGLTVGRGGRFVGEGATLSYEPSGDEPKLFMFSRSGLPYRTRPDIYEHRRASPAQIFTLSAVNKLRASNPGGLDFERQVMPLIKAEMFAEYFGMVARLQGDASALIKDEIAHAFHHGVLESKAAELALRFGVSELARSVFDPYCPHVPVESYQQWVRNLIEEDLAESIADLDHSPIKAAIEVWRTCREQLRRFVDNRGLTAESHATFFGHYAPLVNRMVAGPQKERHQELLALAEAGVLQWVHASRIERDEVIQAVHVASVDNQPAVVLDALVVAHVGDNSRDDGHPALIHRLKASGFIHSRSADRPGLQIDGHGKASAKLWITGPLVEGATYYNHYVPSSGSYSRAFVDADRIAREMLGMTGSEPKPVDTFESHETELALA